MTHGIGVNRRQTGIADSERGGPLPHRARFYPGGNYHVDV